MKWNEILTLAISVFSFTMALITFLSVFFYDRKRVCLGVLAITSSKKAFDENTRMLYVQIMLENRSRLPISITSVEMKLGEDFYPARAGKEYLGPSGMVINVHGAIHKKEDQTIGLPIGIQALSSVGGTLVFEAPLHIAKDLPTPSIFRLGTTRGEIIAKLL